MMGFLGKMGATIASVRKVIPYIRAVSELLDKVVEPIDDFSDKIKQLRESGADE